MIIGDRYRYIFYHVPKNAGTSIKSVLKSEFEGEQMGVHTSVRKSKRLLDDRFNTYFKFAVVRNPYERIVSWYLHLLREAKHGIKKDNIIKPKSFEYFVLKQRQIYKHKDLKEIGIFQTQLDFLSVDGELGVDEVIRFENLNDEFEDLCLDLFRGAPKLPHLKKWGDKNWQKYYDESLKNYIYDQFREDFQNFGYNKH